MTHIVRLKIVEEVVEVPEGNVICGRCKGKALISRYDEGVKSAAYDPDLDAKRTCGNCKGEGYVPK